MIKHYKTHIIDIINGSNPYFNCIKCGIIIYANNNSGLFISAKNKVSSTYDLEELSCKQIIIKNIIE